MFESPFLRRTDRVYSFFITIGNNLQSLFLLYMRLTWGHQFFRVGVGKLAHIEQVAQYFASLHFGAPLFMAYTVGFFETVCGFLLFFGFISRLAAIPLIVIMLTALSTAHAPNLSEFRFLLEPASLVHEAPYPFLITSLLVFLFGPGKISIDAWIKRWANHQPKY